MKTASFLAISLLLFLFVAGCQSAEEKTGNSTSEDITILENEDNKTITDPLLPASTSCTPQWKCISTKVRAFQNENCNFTVRETCPLTCVMDNGTCLKADCKEGYYCRNAQIRSYQDKYCTWMLEERCEFGCKETKCLNASEAPPSENNIAGEAAVETPPPSLYEGVEWINYGEAATFTTGEVEHALSISIIESGRVKVMVDTVRSDWLGEGDTASFAGGTITVNIVEIQFQPYAGGAQKVGYRLYLQ